MYTYAYTVIIAITTELKQLTENLWYHSVVNLSPTSHNVLTQQYHHHLTAVKHTKIILHTTPTMHYDTQHNMPTKSAPPMCVETSGHCTV